MSKEHGHTPVNGVSDESKGTVDLNVEPLDSDTNTPADANRVDPEAGETLSHSILKNGDQVRITWTLEEEARIVRKLDILFLPIFAVSQTATLTAYRG